MKTLAQKISMLNQMNEKEYQKHVMETMGYDPKKEMRHNKLEKMCSILTSTKNHKDDSKHGRLISERDIDFFFNIITEIKPILFKMTESMRDQVVDVEKTGELPIDIPFQIFSIEPADDWHGLYTTKNNKGMLNAQMIVVYEQSPTRLICYTLYNYISNDHHSVPFREFVERSILVFTDDNKPSDIGSLYFPLAIYLNKLDNRTAKVNYQARVKFRPLGFGSKQTIKIKTTAIYIDPSKKYLDKTFGSRNIEWTYSWEVRGHWRKFKGVGKNRCGQKNVEGWTWVKTHIKGEGELIKKDRVVI